MYSSTLSTSCNGERLDQLMSEEPFTPLWDLNRCTLKCSDMIYHDETTKRETETRTATENKVVWGFSFWSLMPEFCGTHYCLLTVDVVFWCT